MSLFKKSNERLYNLKENLKKGAKKTALGLTAVLTGVFASGCRPISQDEAINVMKNETSSDKIEEIIEVAQQDDNTITLKSGAEVILPETEAEEHAYAEAKSFLGEKYYEVVKAMDTIKSNFVEYLLNSVPVDTVNLDNNEVEVNNEDLYLTDKDCLYFLGDKDTNSGVGIFKFDENQLYYETIKALYIDGDRIFVGDIPDTESGCVQFFTVIEHDDKLYTVSVIQFKNEDYFNPYKDADGGDRRSDKENNISYSVTEISDQNKLTQEEFYLNWDKLIRESKQNQNGYTN